MRSIQPTLRESNCVLPFDITQIFLQYVILPRQMSQLFFFLCSSQLECDHVNMFSRQYAVICLYFSFKLIFHRWSLVKRVFLPFYQVSLNIITLVLSRLCSIHTSELTYFRDLEKSAMPSYSAYNWRASW